MMSRCTSHCSPNSCSCAGVGGGEIMLFGVRVKVDPMRKSVSLNNLSQYEQPTANNSGNIIDESSKVVDDGYVSADDALPHHSGAGRERKRGVPWTEEEHKLFLLGLQKVGKGDWRGISRNFVKTRTPTQVASHAQKYFLRRTNLNRRRRRSSLFDITTDSVSVVPTEERKNLLPCIETSKINPFEITVLPAQIKKSIESPLSNSSRTADLNLNQSSTVEGSSLCLTLSLSFDQIQSSSPSQWMSSFSIGESIISVA